MNTDPYTRRLARKMFCRCWLALLLWSPGAHAEQICTYQTFSWDTNARQSVGHTRIVKPYAELSADEVDSFTGCSVCEQDQRSISLPPLETFKVCRVIASRLKNVLQQLLRQGEPIEKIIGYRVGKTRGDVDANGLRTRFSNHSFGIAIDINPDSNGLYDDCLVFSQNCRLIRGGRWNPAGPYSLRADSSIVIAMENMGLKWGGDIAGKQKDFMHFSPSGY